MNCNAIFLFLFFGIGANDSISAIWFPGRKTDVFGVLKIVSQ